MAGKRCLGIGLADAPNSLTPRKSKIGRTLEYNICFRFRSEQEPGAGCLRSVQGAGFTSHIAAGLAVLLLGLCLCACQTPREKLTGYLAAGKRDLESKCYPQVIVRLKIAAGLAPKDAECNCYLGLAYWGSGNLGQAASELKAATDLNPQHLPARMKLAELAARFPPATPWSRPKGRYSRSLHSPRTRPVHGTR